MCISCVSNAEVVAAGAVGLTGAVGYGWRYALWRLGFARRTRAERDHTVAAFLLALGLDPADHLDGYARPVAGTAATAASTQSVTMPSMSDATMASSSSGCCAHE